MNRIDFTQPGGFPLDQDVFGFQQQNIFLAAQAANLGGIYCILSGCVVTGGNVGNGYVAIEGEILPFVGGAASEKVVIIETRTDLNYEDGVARPSEIDRYATFGDDGVTNILWVNFKRNTPEGVLARLERLERVAAPFTIAGKGGMVLWNRPANTIPTGWQEVVDWRGRLPMGYDPDQVEFNTVGKTGGAKGVKMVLANLIAHAHSVVIGFVNGRSDNANDRDVAVPGANTRNTSTAGSEDPTPINVLNPYRTVVFIEYVGG